MDKKVIVGGIVAKEGKFVMVKEKKKEIEGLWNLPMGGLEDNEKIVDGAKREMEEETGMKLKIEKLIGVYHNPDRDGVNVFKFVFLASVISGELHCPEDLHEVKWVSAEEFQKISDKQLRDASITLSVNDWLKGKSYPIDTISYYS